MQKKVKFQGKDFIVKQLCNGKLEIDGHVFEPEVVQEAERLYRVSMGKYQFKVEYQEGKLLLEGNEVDLSVNPYIDIDTGACLDLSGDQSVKAPIPGKILQIFVKVDQIVEKDQDLLILEAMKMRNRIMSPIDGKVAEIYVKEGDAVGQDEILVLLSPEKA